MPLFLVPLVGPFHLRFPRYNAVTVRDVVAAIEPEAIVTTALAPGAFDDPGWQDTEEVALPLAVLPWARRQGAPVVPVGVPSPDPDAMADLGRYLREASSDHPALARLAEARAPVEQALARALDAARVREELLPAIEALHAVRLELFGDGPGSDWLEERADAMAARLEPWRERRTALLAPADHVPALRTRLGDALRPAPDVPPGDEARSRALLDVAFAGEADEPARLLTALRELPQVEARLAEAEILLRHGHPAEALSTLREAVKGDFSRPYHLPGWLLARLGQLYDLDGRRDDALRSYRGVLALDWAPAAAREAARDGLERPFAPTGAAGAE
jgi:tetratricopeptide (TPR) repeat protein